MINGYVICATPRSGSTLFCQYLASTKVAGIPASYFRKEGLLAYAEYWRILHADGSYSFAEYVEATRKAGRTDNGVLALRIMWPTLKEVTARLSQVHPEPQKNDLDLLSKAFGNLKFVYLQRENLIAQAISLYRAQQTGYWHVHEGQLPEQPPVFDFDAIDSLVSELRQDNVAWQLWFRDNGVKPMPIKYEDFARDSEKITIEVLRFLGIELPAKVELRASNRRLSDEITTVWLERYSEELKSHSQ